MREQVPSLWAFGGLTRREVLKRLWSGINDDDLIDRSYELAYNFLVAIFPLLFLLLALFGLLASQGAELRSDLFFYFQAMLPPAGYELLRQTMNEVIRSSGGGKLTLGLLLALYVGSSGTTQLMSTLNVAYAVRETRSWIRVHAISLGLTVIISLLIIVALLLVLGGGYVAEFLGREIGWSRFFVMGWKVLQWLVAIAFVMVAYAIVYFYGPNLKERNWRWITPGSVLGVVLWMVASGTLRLYLHFMVSYTRSYGSLGAVMILLLWFYVTGFAFLIGGELNSVIEHAIKAEHRLETGSKSDVGEAA